MVTAQLYFAPQAASNLPTGLPHTDPTYYLQQAATWANAYITAPNDAADTLNLYDVTGLAHFELYRAMTLAGNPSGLATTKAALLADLKKQLIRRSLRGIRTRLDSAFLGTPMTPRRMVLACR